MVYLEKIPRQTQAHRRDCTEAVISQVRLRSPKLVIYPPADKC